MEILSSIGVAFKHGGEWMWAILGMQIFSLSIIAERTINLYVKRKPDQKEAIAKYEKDIRKGDIAQVIETAKALEKTEPAARAVLAGALAAQNLGGQNEIQAKMDEVLLEENAFLEKRTGFLAMTGNVATLTGLLGTIVGMIKSFAAVAQANPMEKAALVSAGISEAMNCTAYGLIVAIPALVLFAIIQNRANQLAEDLNQGALKLFNWLSYSYESVPARPARSDRRKNDEVTAN
jgi:biopolymer transport protein ExbB/TolQ